MPQKKTHRSSRTRSRSKQGTKSRTSSGASSKRSTAKRGISARYPWKEDPNPYLEVRESNTSARALYARHGFRPVGQRSAYYRNPREDALVLRLELSQPA